MTEKPTIALIENLITLLAYDDVNGKILSRMIDINLFEGDYRLIAERCIDYWRKHDTAPKMHTADLLGTIIHDQYDRRAPRLKNILKSMHDISGQVNSLYVIDQLRRFTRLQRMKSTIVSSAEEINARQEMAIEDVEGMMHEILRSREHNFTPGIWLSDIDRMLQYMDSREREFDVGIEQLDSRNAVPMRGNVLLFLGGAGSGKTWFMINCGKRALMQQKKICHITLELSEELTLQRYYQAIYGLPKRDYSDGFPVTSMIFDHSNKLKGFERTLNEPEFTFKSPAIRDELEARRNWVGNKFNNLLIKRFPPKQLTPNLLRSYLDNLEATEKFIPDLLIIDYLKEMATDNKEYRHSMDNNLSELKGIGVERNVAVVTAQQLSKEGSEAKVARSSHVAEAWGLIGTSDVVLTYSATSAETRHGLARLYVSKNREDEGNYGVLMSQNYRLGQFVLQTHYLPPDYFDHFERYAEKTDKETSKDKEEGDGNKLRPHQGAARGDNGIERRAKVGQSSRSRD